MEAMLRGSKAPLCGRCCPPRGGLKKGGKESKRKKGCKERGGKEKKTFCRCINLRERGNKRERKLLENVFAAVRV